MMKMNNRELRLQKAEVAAVGCMILALLFMNTGCGRSESTSAGSAEKEQSSSSAAVESAPSIPAPEVSEDAPVLSDVYPTLTSGALRLARLTDLSGDILLQAEGVRITESDLRSQWDQAPADAREELRRNAFFLMEQQATMELITALAQRQFGNMSMPQDQLLQSYFAEITRNVSVTDAEIKTFYEENRDLVGDAPLEQVKPRINDHLRQQKQQEAVTDYISNLGSELTIAVSAKWVKEQAALAMDNPVDKARASGRPTFVNFGAKGCVPCDKMEPLREEIKQKYEGRLNVVFVHVNQDRMLASRYGVRGIPHLVFFDKDGKEVHTHTGFMPGDQIEKWVKKIGVSGI